MPVGTFDGAYERIITGPAANSDTINRLNNIRGAYKVELGRFISARLHSRAH